MLYAHRHHFRTVAPEVSACAQHGALAHRPCCHIRSDTERWPQAHEIESSRRERNTKHLRLQEAVHFESLPLGCGLGVLRIAPCSPTIGLCPARGVSQLSLPSHRGFKLKPSFGPKHTRSRPPAPPANEVTANNRSVCAAQEQARAPCKQQLFHSRRSQRETDHAGACWCDQD